MLKQKGNRPLSFYQQAAMIYAATNGYLDPIQVNQIGNYEILLLQKLDNKYTTLVDSMLSEKKLTEEVEQ